MGFLSGISVFCFAASYSVALALEVSRMFFRSGVRGAFMLGFAGAGFVAHTLYLGYRAYTAAAAPLSSPFDWDLLGAWALVAVYLYLTWNHPKTAIGVFLLPLVLGLIGLAQFANRQPFPQTQAGQVWGAIHGIFWVLGLVAVTVGFVAGLMYLIQSYRLKHKLPPPQGLKLPSLEWLERTNGRAIVISALMVGAGFLSGVILNLVQHRQKLDEIPWTDPVIWRSAALFAWLVAAALFSALYRPARSGRKVAYLTVASFAFLAATTVVGLVLPSQHGTITDAVIGTERFPKEDAAFWAPEGPQHVARVVRPWLCAKLLLPAPKGRQHRYLAVAPPGLALSASTNSRASRPWLHAVAPPGHNSLRAFEMLSARATPTEIQS